MTELPANTVVARSAGLAPRRRRRRVPRAAVVALVAALVAVAAAGWLARRLLGPEADTRPLYLPDTFAGRARVPAARDFGAEPSWRETASEDVGGAAVAGAA